MRIKNLRGVSEVRFKKKTDSMTLEMSKNHLIRSILRNGRLRVNVTLVRREQLSSRSQLVKTFLFKFYNNYYFPILNNFASVRKSLSPREFEGWFREVFFGENEFLIDLGQIQNHRFDQFQPAENRLWFRPQFHIVKLRDLKRQHIFS